MATKVTFDWANLLITAKAGVTELDVQIDLYSDWKEDVKLSDNMKHPPAMRTVGGDPISDTQNLGATYFLINGWKIRPDEADHTLVITGNLYTDPAGGEVVIPTLGNYTVLVQMVVSNLVDSSVARLDLTQLLQAVYVDVDNGVSGTDEGVGTPTNPVDNIADAFTIATRDNLREFRMRGSLILDRAVTDWTFTGLGSEIDSELDLDGYSVNNCRFAHLSLTGALQGRVECERCSLDLTTGLDGIFRDCGLISSFSLDASSDCTFSNCFSQVPGQNTPICTVGSNVNANFRNYSGGLELRTVTAGTTISVDLDPGNLVMHSTCTGGTVLVRGTGELNDSSTGTTVLTDGLIQASDVVLTRKVATNRVDTNPSTGILTLYDDDNTVLLTADIYEDIAGLVPYFGEGAERRDKLS